MPIIGQMDPLEVVRAWDASLREPDWALARSLLADDATYTTPHSPPEEAITCASADEIVSLMRSWKGQLPDVEVVEWIEHGDSIVVRLRQPAFGDDADWYQVLWVDAGVVEALEDHPTRESAIEAVDARGRRTG